MKFISKCNIAQFHIHFIVCSYVFHICWVWGPGQGPKAAARARAHFVIYFAEQYLRTLWGHVVYQKLPGLQDHLAHWPHCKNMLNILHKIHIQKTALNQRDEGANRFGE